jgi:hypothetical protein
VPLPTTRRLVGGRIRTMSSERTDTSATSVDGGDGGPQRGEALLRGVALVVTVAAAAAAVIFRAVPERSVAVQALCLFAALVWVGALASEAWRGRRPMRLRPLEWLPGLALLALAFLLRSRMLSYLPLPERTGFEELQMGADGYGVLTSSILPLEFRFSKAIAALGLAWGRPTVEALRLPFQIMGYTSLAVLYLCLRGLGVSRWPSAFVTITAAVSRWFVIGSGVAYEDFSPTLVLLLLMLCLIKVDLKRASATAWAAVAGVMAGVLLFENSSFRFAVLLGVGWVIWVAMRGQREGRGSARWRPLAFFVVTMVLVAAPILLDVVQHGKGSIFFEAVTRYAKERQGAVAPMAWENLRKSLAVLAGWPVEDGSLLAREADRAVHPLTGLLFALAAFAGLVRPYTPFVRALVLAAVFAIVVCSVTTNDFQPTRLAAVASLMRLPVGAFLESVQRGIGRMASRLARFGRSVVDAPPDRRRKLALRAGVVTAIVYVTLSVFIVHASAARIGRMAADRGIWREYANDQYVTALYLAREAKPGSRVLVVTPGLDRIWSPDSIAYWVYAEKRLQVEGVQELPARQAIGRGTLVVLGAEGRALRAEEIERLRALAEETGSLATMDLYRGRGERILVASACVGCDGSVSSTGVR